MSAYVFGGGEPEGHLDGELDRVQREAERGWAAQLAEREAECERLRAEVAALRAIIPAVSHLGQRAKLLAEHYRDNLKDAPDGAEFAWRLLGLALADTTEALRVAKATITGGMCGT
jgi:hypothetical protein